MPLGRGLSDPLTPGCAPPHPCHLDGNAAFVQKFQPLRCDRADLFQERLASLPVAFCVSFLGMERLFFNRIPILTRTTHSEGTLTRSCFSAWSFSCSSAKVKSACFSNQRRTWSRIGSVIFGLRPGKWGMRSNLSGSPLLPPDLLHIPQADTEPLRQLRLRSLFPLVSFKNPAP